MTKYFTVTFAPGATPRSSASQRVIWISPSASFGFTKPDAAASIAVTIE